MSYAAFDEVSVRCPRLGHEVGFDYCRSLENGLPCNRALVCFELRFPVDLYFKAVLEEETFERVFSSATENRVSHILRLATNAKP